MFGAINSNREMVIKFQSGGRDARVRLSVKPASLSASFNDDEVYAFDLEGRLLTAWINGQTFIRTLDNRIIKKWRPGNTSWKCIQQLDSRAARQVVHRSSQRMNDLYRMMRRHQLIPAPDAELDDRQLEAAGRRIESIISWDDDRLERERTRFHSIYEPLSILPPDQYSALALQATIGCHWNRCTFCQFYRNRRFRIKPEQEFYQHIQAVKQFFGQSIKLRRSIFLADANALVIEQQRLLRILDIINQSFTIAPAASGSGSRSNHAFGGIYSFIDAFSGREKTEAEFHEMKQRNLKRVYLGVETGCDQLLSFMNKPASAQRTLELSLTIKRAGLSLGVIILIGAGGKDFSPAHREQTIELLNAMHLARGDILYFSPLFAPPNSEYARRAAGSGLCPLSPEEQRTQTEEIIAGLRFPDRGKPKISRYDIREFIY